MTTELSNLPSNPSVPQTNSAPQIPENIKMETTAYQNNLDKNPTIPPIVDTKQMTTMVDNLESASKQGLTSLAEDIPKDTTHITHDIQSVVNEIPQSPQVESNSTPIDYIKNFATQEDVINQLSNQENKETTVEYILEEIKIPILVGIFFYVFHNKKFHKIILSKVPSFFNDTGGLSTNGLLALSAMFGVTYYSSLKVMKHFSL